MDNVGAGEVEDVIQVRMDDYLGLSISTENAQKWTNNKFWKLKIVV